MLPAMASFLPCPSCGRHVRSSERACPFCGHANAGREIVGRSLSPLPELLPALLLGLTLAACTSKDAKPAGDTKAKTTTTDPTASGGSAGQDDGADAGAEPRPAEKYGGPPMDDGPDPSLDPETPVDDGSTIADDPRPTEKYGGPPLRDEKLPKPAPAEPEN